MKYKIVETRDAETLENKVNHLIDQGYKPLGGMRVIVSAYSSLIFYQTLILEDNRGQEKLEFLQASNHVLRN